MNRLKLFDAAKRTAKENVSCKPVSYMGENYWDAMRFQEMKIKPVKIPISKYLTVTAKDTALRSVPPTTVKMLSREFIHDSLYNPYYGYFSKKA